MFIVGDVELLAMLMNSPNNQFHHLCLTLRGASGSRRPAMLGNMDRTGLRDSAGSKTNVAKVREHTGDCCTQSCFSCIRKRAKDIWKEVETNIIECIKKRLPSQGRNGGPEVVGGIKARSSIEANLDVEIGTLDFLFCSDNPANQGFPHLGNAAIYLWSHGYIRFLRDLQCCKHRVVAADGLANKGQPAVQVLQLFQRESII